MWQNLKFVAKAHRKAAHVEDGRDSKSDDKGEDNSEEEEQYNSN
jgi:hypothetical protein